MLPCYPIPRKVFLKAGLAALTGTRRSFREDALACVAKLEPLMKVDWIGSPPDAGISSVRPCVITVNHYARPGFSAWWLALGISAALPVDVHWVITAAWTYPDRLRASTLTPFSRWLFRRVAHTYGFTNMPAMPPKPDEVEARATAVRRVLRYAKGAKSPLVGLSPEGGDFAPPGGLADPPSGAGRFILLLSDLGLEILPVAAYEDNERFCLRFGLPYHLEIPPGHSRAERDCLASQLVMSRIAELLPPALI
jgi:hypothetical protein